MQTLGGSMKAGEKRVATERCAYLAAVAIANRMDEVWISLHPILFGLYVAQYFPTFYRRCVSLYVSRCMYFCLTNKCTPSLETSFLRACFVQVVEDIKIKTEMLGFCFQMSR